MLSSILKFFLFLLLLSCQPAKTSPSNWMQPNGKIKVLSTLAMIDDIVKQIGGEYVDSISLIKGELDPHSYQLVKGDDEKLKFASLIFYNGLGLEHGPSLHQYLAHNPKAIGLGDKIQEKDKDIIITQNGQIDPHIWMDVSLWKKIVPLIEEELKKIDPAHAEVFHANSLQLEQKMDDLHKEIHTQLQHIPSKQRYLVTSHDAFNYFTRGYLAEENELPGNDWQKRFQAPEGLAPESQLSVAEIQWIINYMQKYSIHMLFPESNVSRDSINKIVSAGKEKGLNLKIANAFLYADAMGKAGSTGDTYLKMMKYNADTIEHYLLQNYP